MVEGLSKRKISLQKYELGLCKTALDVAVRYAVKQGLRGTSAERNVFLWTTVSQMETREPQRVG